LAVANRVLYSSVAAVEPSPSSVIALVLRFGTGADGASVRHRFGGCRHRGMATLFLRRLPVGAWHFRLRCYYPATLTASATQTYARVCRAFCLLTLYRVRYASYNATSFISYFNVLEARLPAIHYFRAAKARKNGAADACTPVHCLLIGHDIASVARTWCVLLGYSRLSTAIRATLRDFASRALAGADYLLLLHSSVPRMAGRRTLFWPLRRWVRHARPSGSTRRRQTAAA